MNSISLTLHLNDPTEIKISPLRDEEPAGTIYCRPAAVAGPALIMSPEYAHALAAALNTYLAAIPAEAAA